MSFTAKQSPGLTFVELLIVIVVIAILATISIVAYNGIQERARESHILSDLSNAAKQLQIYNAEKGDYPTTSNISSLKIRLTFPSAIPTNTFICLDNANRSGFMIYARMASNTALQYRVTSESAPAKLSSPISWDAVGTCSGSTPSASWGQFWVAAS
jgi:general secretion pathway protein G